MFPALAACDTQSHANSVTALSLSCLDQRSVHTPPATRGADVSLRHE